MSVRKFEAKKLGWRVAALDAEVEKARAVPGPAANDKPSLFPQVTPWDQPVDLAGLLRDFADTIDRHLVLLPSARDLVALWILHTWVYRKFDYTPRLGITSPVKRCGKSTPIDLLRETCCRPLKADSLTTAVVFRAVEAWSPMTLLVDEADTFLRDNQELRGVLDSGYERSGCVFRKVERDNKLEPAGFMTFAPVAFAAIGDLPGTLADRALPIRLERKDTNRAVTRMRSPGARQTVQRLAQRAARWAHDNCDRLNPDPSVPLAFNDREADICVPLLSIADLAGEMWSGRAGDALVNLFSQWAEESNSLGIKLAV